MLQLWTVGPSWAQALPKEQEIVVTGQILGTDGPQSKARVELRPLLSSYERGRTLLAGKPAEKDEPAPAAGALTDDGGFFRVLAPAAGMWRLVAQAPGKVPMEYPTVPLTEEMDVPPVDLPRDAGLEVKVVGDGGAPISGAKVLVSQRRVRDAYTSWKPAWEPAERFGITDAKGRLALPALQGEDLTVEVVAPGFQPRSLAARPSRVTVQLSRGTERRIEVLDTRRRPAGDVLVWVEGMGLPAASSGDGGRLSLTLPGEKRTAVRLLAAGGEHLEADIVLQPGAERVRLTLKPPETVSGRVIDILQRGPIAGALVWMGRDYATYVRTDRAGNYVLKPAPGAQRTLRAVANGYFEDVEGPTFALSPKAFLHGSVVDGQGKALAGVEIRVRYDPGAVRRASLRLRGSGSLTRSRGQGDFRAGGLVPGATYTLRFARPGFAPQIVKAEAPRTGSPGIPIRVVLTPGKVAFGSVLDENERPIPGAVVELVPASESNPALRLQQIREPDAALRTRAVTDASGRFEMRGVQTGRFDLAVQARGFAAVRVPGIGIPAQRERFDLGTVVLKPEVLLSGRVQTPEGTPLEGASVRIKPEDPLEEAAFDENAAPDAVTDATGWFQISGRRAGDMLKLVVARAGFATAELAGVAVNPEKPLVVVLNPASLLAGRVVDEDSRPVAGILLTAISQRMVVVGGATMTRGLRFQTRSRDDGSFALQGVEPGRVQLTASEAGWQTVELDLKVPEGKDLEGVEVVLRKAAILTGRVSGPDGAPVVGAEIRRHVPEQPGMFTYYGPWTSTDGDGRYRIDGLAAGPLSAEASHETFGRAIRELDLQPGENVLDFELDGRGEVSGLVLDGLGSPVAGARVRLLATPFSGPSSQILSQPDGRFTVRGLAAGTYDVSASKEGLGQTRAPVSVQVGEAAGQEVVLELVRYGVIRGRILGLDPEDLARVRLSIAWAPAEAAQVSHDGSYRISDVPPGSWRVAAQLPRTGRQAEGEVTVDAETGEGRLDLDFRQGLSLSGVVQRNGKPLPGASLRATGKTGAPAWSETDPEGRFALQGLSPDLYILEVSDFRTGLFHSREIDLQGDQRVVIDLKTGSLRGVVVDARSGEPIPQAEITISPAPGSFEGRQNTVTGLDGSFSFPELSQGSWSLSVTGPGYQPLTRVVSISGSEALYDLALAAQQVH
ncbi:MAG TPA: carboxypeptidase-like regulatory domain-containing protein [Thermoanaerobaculia bacterium]